MRKCALLRNRVFVCGGARFQSLEFQKIAKITFLCEFFSKSALECFCEFGNFKIVENRKKEIFAIFEFKKLQNFKKLIFQRSKTPRTQELYSQTKKLYFFFSLKMAFFELRNIIFPQFPPKILV